MLLDTVDQSETGRQSAIPSPQSAIPSSADVLVIGAGYTGLSAARRLALSGASVLVVERDAIGSGASSRNGGQVLTELRLDPSTLVRRYGEPAAREMFGASLAAIDQLEHLIAAESIDCEYEHRTHPGGMKPAHFGATLRRDGAAAARVRPQRRIAVES
jgi:glycine/D-amino acid oxidase-like deaminating enzyme